MPRIAVLVLIALTSGLILIAVPTRLNAESETVTFDIVQFEISGNTLLPEYELQAAVQPYTGSGRTAQDVEKARNALERFLHGKGYPAVLVNIPEQSVAEGTVRLQVIESTIRRVRVVGNRYFTMEKILTLLPSIQPGEVLYLPDVREELAEVNRSPDLKVAPMLMPGKEVGTIDVELRVKDRLPLHGELELNNRNTHSTTDLRLNALIRYDNLWQRDHSITVQYQTSPEDTDEVKALATSYVLPSPLNRDHILALYGVWSDSDTAFGQGFEVVGNGFLVGLRNVIPLAPAGGLSHNLTLGVDYKDFDEGLSFLDQDEEGVTTPVKYWPFLIGYGASIGDKRGITTFDSSVNFVLRDVAADVPQFEDKRYKAGANYIYLTARLERLHYAFWNSAFFLQADGQLADQPLIANEQFIAGGMKSVRGYKESEVAGDNGIHATIEWRTPDLERLVEWWEPLDLSIFGFYDMAALSLNDPLPGEDGNVFIAGAGAGVRGKISRYLIYEFDWGVALEDTDLTEAGDQNYYFEVRFQF